MGHANNFLSLCLVALMGLLGVWNGLPVSAGVVLNTEESLERCPFKEPRELGNIREPELRETSGMVGSKRHPGIYYAIQDSQTCECPSSPIPCSVYAMRYDGEALGIYNAFDL